MSRVVTEDDGDTVPCPHCKARQGDLWDHRWDEECIETNCGTCGKLFTLTRIVDVSYTAEAEVSDSEGPADDGEDFCDEPSDNHRPLIVCTRAKGHGGDHVGHGAADRELGRWPQ